jgi:hypothetical protein
VLTQGYRTPDLVPAVADPTGPMIVPVGGRGMTDRIVELITSGLDVLAIPEAEDEDEHGHTHAAGSAAGSHV